MERNRIDPSQKTIQPNGKQLCPVKEQTIYPAQFPIFLQSQMQGRTVAEVGEILGMKPADVIRLLGGQWRPSKEVCRRMGLKLVYAIGSSA